MGEQYRNANQSQAEVRRFLQFYDQKYPWLREAKAATAAQCLLASRRIYHTTTGLAVFLPLPPTPAGHKMVRDAVRDMERFVEAHREMTALANDLAFGRDKLGHDGRQTRGMCLSSLRPLGTFYDTEGTTSGSIGSDWEHQARGYAYELNWLEGLIPRWKAAAEGWKNHYRLAKSPLPVITNKVASHDESKEWDLETLCRELKVDSEKMLIQSYVQRFDHFSSQWKELLIRGPSNGRPVRTLLAYTDAHIKVFNTLSRQGKKLLKASQELEQILCRAATMRQLRDGEIAVVLPLDSFDTERAVAYRDELLENLGQHDEFPFAVMPQLLQRWQSDKLSRAVAKLVYLERIMKKYIQAKHPDPDGHGIHLRIDSAGRLSQPAGEHDHPDLKELLSKYPPDVPILLCPDQSYAPYPIDPNQFNGWDPEVQHGEMTSGLGKKLGQLNEQQAYDHAERHYMTMFLGE